MTTWQQNYDPLNSWVLSTFVSALPVLTLFHFLVGLRKRGWAAPRTRVKPGKLALIGVLLRHAIV